MAWSATAAPPRICAGKEDGYDCGVAYADQHIGQLCDALAKQGVLDDLAIIITADHGENLGELGIYGEHATADQATCRVPLIVRWPGLASGQVDHGLHYHLDLNPTRAELLGRKSPTHWDGQSYARTLRDGTGAGREFLVVGQCAHVCQRSVRFGPWLWMRTWHDGFHLFPDEMLFDLATDPHEQIDLAPQRIEVCREAAALLEQWHHATHAAVDPLETVLAEGGPFHAKGRLKEYCERLTRTGRGWAVAELKKRHPREFELDAT